MKDIYIDNLIAKFMTKSIAANELDQLSKWIEVEENEKYFFEFVKINYALDLNFATYDKEMAKKKFLKNIERNNKNYKKKNNNFWKYAVAASIALLIAVGYYFTKENSITEPNTIVNQESKIKIGTDKATLTLEDGSLVALEKGTGYKAENVESNGEKLIYNKSQEKTTPEIAYNYLTIPRGGQFYVELSDNTKVWLNSESKLKYPVSFIEGQTRKVELVYGEAYFDVSPSSEHDGAKFKVLAQRQEVDVLGTEFNVKAYRDEASIYTTLVEGSVALIVNNQTAFLKPGQQSTFDSEDNTVKFATVDTYNETSWKEGVFSFKSKTLVEIIKVLSRWYNIEIIISDPKIAQAKFNGVLSKKQPLEEILTTIKNTNFISAYEIEKNRVLLK